MSLIQFKQIKMQSMNFLNKKYSNVHNVNPLAHSRNRTTRSFIPNANTISSHTIPTSMISHSNRQTQLTSNHCNTHQQQLIRHLCTDCIQLLCSQCISQHISIHKQNKTFPNIQTLKQIRNQMSIKLQQLTNQILSTKNNPKLLKSSVDIIRNETNNKIDNLKKDLIQFIQQWIIRLRTSIINNIGYQEIKLIQQQMYSLHQQVNLLNNSLNNNNVNVQDIKKAYQVDADRLMKSYYQMMDKYVMLSDAMKVDIDLDASKFMQGLESAIALRVVSKVGKEQKEGVQSKVILNHLDQDTSISPIVHITPNKIQKNQQIVPLPMVNFITGTQTIRILSVTDQRQKAQNYQLKGIINYPLSSGAILADGLVVISGGMISQNKKNDIIQVYDYEKGQIITSSKLHQGRSSHQTFINDQQILLIGGFIGNNQQCHQIQIMTINNIEVSKYKCRWGGPNLCIRINNDQLIKITVSGVQKMSLKTLQWQQIMINVPFALSKGMQISSYEDNGYETIVIFGQDQFYYKWAIHEPQMNKISSNLVSPIIAATSWRNVIYGWVIQDNQTKIYCLNQGKWILVKKGHI